MDPSSPAHREPFVRRWAPIWAAVLVAFVLQAAARAGLPSVDNALYAGSADDDEWLDGGWALGMLALGGVGLLLGMAYQALLRPSSRWDAFVFGALAVVASSPGLLLRAALIRRDTEGYAFLLAVQMVFLGVPTMAAGGAGAALGAWAVRWWRRRHPPANPAPVVSDDNP